MDGCGSVEFITGPRKQGYLLSAPGASVLCRLRVAQAIRSQRLWREPFGSRVSTFGFTVPAQSAISEGGEGSVCLLRLCRFVAVGRRGARLLLGRGFSCLDQIAQALSIPVEEDIDPDGETQLTFVEFNEAVEMLRSVGYPIEHSAQQAWPHFAGGG